MIIKSFKTFIDRGKITYSCHKLGIKKFKVRQDGKVDVDGDVNIYRRQLKNIPVKFGNVSGDFNCEYNLLRNLENCPDFVGGDFRCAKNQINTLEFLPKKIEGGFLCGSNDLKDIQNLKNCDIGGEIYLGSNYINSLEGAPKKVFGSFNLSWNNLEDIQNCPEFISGSLILNDNQINYLTGFPRSVGGHIDLINSDIWDFRGIPEETNFDCEIMIQGNPVWEVVGLFEDQILERDEYLTLGILMSINEWGAIYGRKIIWDRLVEVFHDFEIEPPDPESEGFQERKKSILESGYEIIF